MPNCFFALRREKEETRLKAKKQKIVTELSKQEFRSNDLLQPAELSRSVYYHELKKEEPAVRRN